MAKSKKFTIIANPELLQAVKGFAPKFGNQDDAHVVEQMQRLTSMLEKVDNKILRGDKSKLTKKMKDILFLERGLIHSIIRRNLDF